MYYCIPELPCVHVLRRNISVRQELNHPIRLLTRCREAAEYTSEDETVFLLQLVCKPVSSITKMEYSNFGVVSCRYYRDRAEVRICQ